MAAFTVNANANWTDAAFVTRAGNDTYTLGANVTLTIDSDTRYGPNCSATTGNVSTPTFSAAGASGIYSDGSKVRLIPFNAGSGNVPAVGATISQGAVSAELLGVWAGLSGAPTAAGAAMPASGFIKVRNKAGGDFAAGALTGIGATSKRADIVGWIEVAVVAGMIWQPGKLARAVAALPTDRPAIWCSRVINCDPALNPISLSPLPRHAPGFRHALIQNLEVMDVEVIVAWDGFRCLKKLKEHPDIGLLLLDLAMPGMDGLQVLEHIRSDEKTKNLPVLVISADVMKGGEKDCLEAGADGYAAKPLDFKNLVGMMENLLGPDGT